MNLEQMVAEREVIKAREDAARDSRWELEKTIAARLKTEEGWASRKQFLVGPFLVRKGAYSDDMIDVETYAAAPGEVVEASVSESEEAAEYQVG